MKYHALHSIITSQGRILILFLIHSHSLFLHYFFPFFSSILIPSFLLLLRLLISGLHEESRISAEHSVIRKATGKRVNLISNDSINSRHTSSNSIDYLQGDSFGINNSAAGRKVLIGQGKTYGRQINNCSGSCNSSEFTTISETEATGSLKSIKVDLQLKSVASNNLRDDSDGGAIILNRRDEVRVSLTAPQTSANRRADYSQLVEGYSAGAEVKPTYIDSLSSFPSLPSSAFFSFALSSPSSSTATASSSSTVGSAVPSNSRKNLKSTFDLALLPLLATTSIFATALMLWKVKLAFSPISSQQQSARTGGDLGGSTTSSAKVSGLANDSCDDSLFLTHSSGSDGAILGQLDPSHQNHPNEQPPPSPPPPSPPPPPPPPPPPLPSPMLSPSQSWSQHQPQQLTQQGNKDFECMIDIDENCWGLAKAKETIEAFISQTQDSSAFYCSDQEKGKDPSEDCQQLDKGQVDASQLQNEELLRNVPAACIYLFLRAKQAQGAAQEPLIIPGNGEPKSSLVTGAHSKAQTSDYGTSASVTSFHANDIHINGPPQLTYSTNEGKADDSQFATYGIPPPPKAVSII